MPIQARAPLPSLVPVCPERRSLCFKTDLFPPAKRLSEPRSAAEWSGDPRPSLFPEAFSVFCSQSPDWRPSLISASLRSSLLVQGGVTVTSLSQNIDKQSSDLWGTAWVTDTVLPRTNDNLILCFKCRCRNKSYWNDLSFKDGSDGSYYSG